MNRIPPQWRSRDFVFTPLSALLAGFGADPTVDLNTVTFRQAATDGRLVWSSVTLVNTPDHASGWLVVGDDHRGLDTASCG